MSGDRDGGYTIGVGDGIVILQVDADDDAIVRLRMPVGEARRMATLILAACDIVDGDEVDDVIARARA